MPSRNQMVAYEDWWWVISSAALWPVPSHNISHKTPTHHAAHTNMPYPLVLAQGHALTTATHTTNTILSIDGVGAYDTISRQSMLQGLLHTVNSCLPFVRLWYAQPSEYVWHDGHGQPQILTQAEGGEQGDPLMPALFSLGQHAALTAVQRSLQPGETLYAYLDGVLSVSVPSTTCLLTTSTDTQPSASTVARPGSGTIRPRALRPHQLPARNLGRQPRPPPEQQGLTVLGVPLGSPEFVQHQLNQTLAAHPPLLQQLPHINDLQAAWLLLLYTASPRSNYLLRLLPPHVTETYAQEHDAATTECLAHLLGHYDMPATAIATAHLPLAQGGLGLAPARLLAPAAYSASWVPARPAAPSARHSSNSSPTPDHRRNCTSPLSSSHCSPTNPRRQWLGTTNLDTTCRPPTAPHQQQLTRWSHATRVATTRSSATPLQTRARTEVYQHLDPAGQAMLDSQSGPYASRAFTTVPYATDTTYPSHLFRLLLPTRLRLPLPLSEHTCRCRRTLDLLGNHRAACSTAGVLRTRGVPLERAAARVCKEAGARVTVHTRVADLNLPAVQQVDDRRIEVIANGLSLHNGSQLAIDTTLVAPLTSTGQPRRRGGQFAAAALHDARKAKERAYPELRTARRCRLVVLAIEIGGRWSTESQHTSHAGLPRSHTQPCMLSPPRWSPSPLKFPPKRTNSPSANSLDGGVPNHIVVGLDLRRP